MLYEDWKGYENPWRKHHVAPDTHDLWLYDAKTGVLDPQAKDRSSVSDSLTREVLPPSSPN